MRELSTDGANKCVLARDSGGEDETPDKTSEGRKRGKKTAQKAKARTRFVCSCMQIARTGGDHVFASLLT